MFEVGQVFSKSGIDYCVLDLIKFNNKNYVLMSVEDGNIEYLFYEINKTDTGFKLDVVVDDELNYNLFNIEEVRNSE